MKHLDNGPEILFQDNHLLVLNKPAGLATQPCSLHDSSLEEWGKKWLKEKYQKPGNVFLQAVHRIDRSVSGIVLFARTSKALSRLQESMRSKEIEKKYLAIAEGKIDKKEGIFEDWITHASFRAMIVGKGEGKWSSLYYRVIKEEKKGTLVEVALHTGRYHQIRLQFSARGHTLFGDRKYGSEEGFLPGSIALHHHCMQFFHPISKERLKLEAPLPHYWLREYLP